MTRDLLIRGMIAGILAALLMTLFARAFGEPQVDRAIAYEEMHQDHAMSGAPQEPELVSRPIQKGLGLLTALGLYGAAVGGIFSLTFAMLYGRVASIGPRSLALLLAVGAFIAVAVVPALKYPPTPPAVGRHETVAFRTIAYFALIALSLVAMVISVKVGRVLSSRLGPFNALLAGSAIYVAIVAASQTALPTIDEVPVDFPAVVLWDFRVAALGIQAILWAALGVIFGALADRALRRSGG
jgi:hypothetical protein